MMQVEMLFPDHRVVSLEELRHALTGWTEAEPFNSSLVEAAIGFSQRIFRDSEARKYPELLALAYWMRKSEITRLAAQFRSLQLEQRVLIPRGLVFHLPPRNVDTIFVYSWLLSALTGNKNVIRLSPQRSESTNILLRLLRETLGAASEPAKSSTIIVSYGHEEEPTAMLSAVCDVRVTWGGDRTVETIRRSPLAAHAGEITFPDRYSMAAIRADAYAELPEQRRNYLVEQFFNDSFWFDQLGCSSPRLVIWCGDQSRTKAASSDFFDRLAACLKRRQYNLPASASMQKLLFTCSAILDFPVAECRRYHEALIILTLDSLVDFQRDHPGGGLFFEAHLGSLLDLAPTLGRRDQTLTWFGFTPEELHTLVRNLNGRSIDRIVPFGQALQFHRFWDGNDLLQQFCRCVYIDSSVSDVKSPQQSAHPAVIAGN
jgi:hypothetical protein